MISPLKWAGGKRRLAPFLMPYWESEKHRRFVEPFAGAASVSLHLQPDHVWINDINPHVINFFRWLRAGAIFDDLPDNEETAYYTARERFNAMIETEDSVSKDAAGLFYYLNRTGFNGLCRFNASGLFNVPYGHYQRVSYQRDFSEYRDVLQSWLMTSFDFRKMTFRPSDFVYADPPYDGTFSQYAQRAFTWTEQIRLAEKLSDHPGPVLVSNASTPRIHDVYTRLGFAVIEIAAKRSIQPSAERESVEILAIRNLPHARIT